VRKLTALEEEQDNFRAALRWSQADGGRAVTGLQIALALDGFWPTRGYPNEGRRWLTDLLRGARDVKPQLRARALGLLGSLTRLEGRYDESLSYYERAMALYRELGDDGGIATTLAGLGNTRRFTRDYAGARDALEGALAINRVLGNRGGIAEVLNSLGAVASNEKMIERAIALYGESLQIARELGDTWRIASRLGNLAEVTMYHGQIDEAASMHQESLALWLRMGDRRSIAEGLEMFVETLCAQNRMQLAARLLGAVEALREEIGCPRPPVDAEVIGQAIDATRSSLGEEAFARAWSEGRSLSDAQAVAQAIG